MTESRRSGFELLSKQLKQTRNSWKSSVSEDAQSLWVRMSNEILEKTYLTPEWLPYVRLKDLYRIRLEQDAKICRSLMELAKVTDNLIEKYQETRLYFKQMQDLINSSLSDMQNTEDERQNSKATYALSCMPQTDALYEEIDDMLSHQVHFFMDSVVNFAVRLLVISKETPEVQTISPVSSKSLTVDIPSDGSFTSPSVKARLQELLSCQDYEDCTIETKYIDETHLQILAREWVSSRYVDYSRWDEIISSLESLWWMLTR